MNTNIEKLLASDPNQIENALLKEAVSDLQKAQNEKIKKNLVAALAEIQRRTIDRVNIVRQIRAQEKAALADLRKNAEAETAFMKSGNVKEYAEAVFGKDTRASTDFVNRFDSVRHGW